MKLTTRGGLCALCIGATIGFGLLAALFPVETLGRIIFGTTAASIGLFGAGLLLLIMLELVSPEQSEQEVAGTIDRPTSPTKRAA